jgi:hypothetical protein
MWKAVVPSTSTTLIATVPEAIRYATAAFVSGDLATGRVTVSISRTSARIDIGGPAREPLR